ncbi:MAG: biliverdin-producing heme oxygenase [Hyphomonadaceae bacterium]
MDIALEAPAAARTLLRDACGETHARLDQKLSNINFDDRGAYTHMLERISGPLGALEAALSADLGPALLSDWPQRRRTPALRADLAALGGSFQVRFAPPITDEAEALGVLYVLEGSRLGGRVLARMAAESADPAVRGATHFFRHAEHAGHWRDFLAVLETSSAVRANPVRAKRGALDAFARFEAAFA